MKIAFYAPMKSPRHPVPSGDRLMARQLLRVLGNLADDVRLASELRSYAREPNEHKLADGRAAGQDEVRRLIADWHREHWQPDIWFCYHPYYKAPDWIGPQIKQQLGAKYVTAEASYAPRRADGPWSSWTDALRSALQVADVHFYMKECDIAGLREASDGAHGMQLIHLPPFIDAGPFAGLGHDKPTTGPARLITVAMMRPDVKLKSYRFLAAALACIQHFDWHLDIVGDGDARAEVRAALAPIPADRITFHGQLEPDAVRAVLSRGHVFVWPGLGEAYGLAYLEAQAAGCAVVAQHTAGVPEVVRDGETGLLTAESETKAFADAILRLVGDPGLVSRFGSNARSFVTNERSFANADTVLRNSLGALKR